MVYRDYRNDAFCLKGRSTAQSLTFSWVPLNKEHIRLWEDSGIPYCRTAGLSLEARSSYLRGFLSLAPEDTLRGPITSCIIQPLVAPDIRVSYALIEELKRHLIAHGLSSFSFWIDERQHPGFLSVMRKTIQRGYGREIVEVPAPVGSVEHWFVWRR